MSTSISNLVNNLSEGLHNDRCIDCQSCLDYMMTKDNQLIFRCFLCKKNYKNGLQIHINFAMVIIIKLFCH